MFETEYFCCFKPGNKMFILLVCLIVASKIDKGKSQPSITYSPAEAAFFFFFFFRGKGLGSFQNVISPAALTCSEGISCQWSKTARLVWLPPLDLPIKGQV